MATLRLRINGIVRETQAASDTHLLGVLRDEWGLVGTRFGCGSNECGACHVLIDGRSIASCETTLAAVQGHEVITVEGLDPRLAAAFVAEQAAQCGYCSSGMLIGAAALLKRTPRPSEHEVKAALEAHLCRCGVHNRIVRAVLRAAEGMA